MQKSIASSLLLKPTVYETFVRSWPTLSTSTDQSSLTHPVTSTATSTITSSSLSPLHVRGSVSLGAAPGTQTSISGASPRRPFCTFTQPAKGTARPHLIFRPHSNVYKRTMASNQPLTSSTLPTATELRLQTSPDSLQTARGQTLNPHQSLLISSVLDLFAGHPTLRKLTLWNDDATFRDPLTVATGRKQFSAQWYGLATAFSSIERLSYQVTNANGNPMTMDLSTKYKVKGVGTEKTINSIVEVWVDEKTGKIKEVVDKWDGELDTKEGGIKHAFRKLNAVSVPAMVHVPKSIEEEERGAENK